MARFTWAEILQATAGKPLTTHKLVEQSLRVWTDTRTLTNGDIFLPLSGERFNGHDYLGEALSKGAVGAFVSIEEWTKRQSEWQSLPNLIGVSDPIRAYLAMARFHRRRINPTVIALTGSSGKTTTKDMLYAAFSRLKKTQKTEKNFNNEVGVSQTLLSIQPDTQLMIVEMGMRGRHQIDLLSEYAEPDIALITNVGPAHIGLLGSLENIAHAKLEITEGLKPATGILVINGEDPWLSKLAPVKWTGMLKRFQSPSAMETTAQGMVFTYQGHRIQLQVPGQHNVSNAMAVLTVGEALGFSLDEMIPGLEAFLPEGGRWNKEPLPGYTNAWVINDAYNANPDSTKASLTALLESTTPDLKKILVLGGMKELGDFAQSYHEALGYWLAQQKGIDRLFLVGEEAAWLAHAAQSANYPVIPVATAADVVETLRNQRIYLDNTLLFLKGSRYYKLEEIPQALTLAGASGETDV